MSLEDNRFSGKNALRAMAGRTPEDQIGAIDRSSKSQAQTAAWAAMLDVVEFLEERFDVALMIDAPVSDPKIQEPFRPDHVTSSL